MNKPAVYIVVDASESQKSRREHYVRVNQMNV